MRELDLSIVYSGRSESLSSYDIFAINIASTMLGYVYGKGLWYFLPTLRNTTANVY